MKLSRITMRQRKMPEINKTPTYEKIRDAMGSQGKMRETMGTQRKMKETVWTQRKTWRRWRPKGRRGGDGDPHGDVEVMRTQRRLLESEVNQRLTQATEGTQRCWQLNQGTQDPHKLSTLELQMIQELQTQMAKRTQLWNDDDLLMT